MAELPPSPMDELLPPAQAWGLRLLVLGMALLLLGSWCYDARDFPGRMLAEKVVATGDIMVMGTSDERAEKAFAQALAAQPVEAGMNFIKSDRQSRTYQVWLTAPNRDAALAQVEALLERFQREFGGDFGRDVTTFTKSWVPPMQTPKVRAWGRGMRVASWSMLAVGAGMMAGGGWILWVAMQGDKKKVADLIFNNEEPGLPPSVSDGDSEQTPKPGPPPPTGGEPETKVL